MRGVRVAVASAACLAALAGPAAAAPPSVRGTILTELRMFEARNYYGMWMTLTTRYRTVCERAVWQRGVERGRAAFPDDARFVLRGLVVRYHPGFAAAAYTLTYGGRIVAQVEGDVYVREAGRWRDELDAVTGCTP